MFGFTSQHVIITPGDGDDYRSLLESATPFVELPSFCEQSPTKVNVVKTVQHVYNVISGEGSSTSENEVLKELTEPEVKIGLMQTLSPQMMVFLLMLVQKWLFIEVRG